MDGIHDEKGAPMPHDPAKPEKTTRALLGCTAFLAVVACLGWVVLHFILKYW